MFPIQNARSLPLPEQLDFPLDVYQECYEQWRARQISQGTLVVQKLAFEEHRKALLADWLRDLVASGYLNHGGRLPVYSALSSTFALSSRQVTNVVNQLRHENVLAPRRPRQDAGKPQWQRRDAYCLWWIGEQRAIRYDQLQQLLAGESDGQPHDPQCLSMTRTTQLINRWKRAHLVEYRKIYVKQPGWIWLTRKGLAFAELDYRPGSPAESSLSHLYYINEVRLLLEEEYPEEQLTWTSERALHHRREQMRKRGNKLDHLPDGVVTMGEERIDIEVELTRKPQREVERVICGTWAFSSSSHALCYYVSRQTRATVNAAWREVQRSKGVRGIRPWVEVVELDTLFQPPEHPRS